MAANPIVDGLLQQGQGIITAVVGNLHGQIQNILSNAFGQLSGLLGSVGRFDFLNTLQELAKPLVDQAIQGLLGQLTGVLGGLIGGM